LSWADCAYGDDCVCGVRDSRNNSFFLHGNPLIGQPNFQKLSIPSIQGQLHIVVEGKVKKIADTSLEAELPATWASRTA
jgi:hypothetical protein